MNRKASSTYIEPSTSRKKDIIEANVNLHEGVPVFNLIEFNIYGACNRSCSFCPVSDTTFYTNTFRGIDIELYDKILRELSDIKYKGTILFSAFSEPLLNNNIFQLIKSTKDLLEESNLEIVTNGDVIIKKNSILKKLFEHGLDVLSISIYDGPESFNKFNQLIEKSNFSKDQIILRRRYEEFGNFGMTISNRIGLIDSNKYRSEEEDPVKSLPLKNHCYYPFYQMVVDYNGDVLLCAHDWKKEKIIGNAKIQNIFEIWKSKYIREARLLLKDKNRCFAPCINCDVKGNIMGKPNFDSWINYYEK